MLVNGEVGVERSPMVGNGVQKQSNWSPDIVMLEGPTVLLCYVCGLECVRKGLVEAFLNGAIEQGLLVTVCCDNGFVV